MIRWTCVLVLLLVAGCANVGTVRTETVLPLQRAWVDGRQVEYITTDISDADMAHATGVNFVPRLRQAIGAQHSVLERVYKFSAGEQISIFQSAPRPVGPNNADRAYSPLWRLVLVTWRAPQHRRELKSEEALLAAQEAGHVALELTDIVVNCPVTKTVGAEGLAGVR